MFVPVMFLRKGCESAARELQGHVDHFPKIRLFTQRLVRAYVSFDKGSEQIHSVLYGFGHRDWRKVARLFQLHIRFTNITPKILPIQIFDLAPVDDIQIRILPIKLDKEYRNLLQIDS